MTTRELDRAGVRIAYRTDGASGPDVLLLPPWQIVDSRIWDEQVPHLANTARVLTYDSRGSGWSGRPRDPAAYATAELVADALAVLDAAGADRAVVVGHSLGGVVAYLLAALHPERVAGLVLLAPSVDVIGDETAPLHVARRRFDDDTGGPDEGWDRYNRHAWHRDFPGFVRWFLATAAPEPHVERLRRQAVARAMENDPDVLAATVAARQELPAGEQARLFRTLARAVRCSTLVVHGARDAVVPSSWGRAVATLLGARYVELPDTGHCPQLSAVGPVNDLLDGFVARVTARIGS